MKFGQKFGWPLSPWRSKNISFHSISHNFAQLSRTQQDIVNRKTRCKLSRTGKFDLVYFGPQMAKKDNVLTQREAITLDFATLSSQYLNLSAR